MVRVRVRVGARVRFRVRFRVRAGATKTLSGVISKTVEGPLSAGPVSPGFLAFLTPAEALTHVSVCALRPLFSRVTWLGLGLGLRSGLGLGSAQG